LTGEGYGAKEFTWSGLVVDMLNIDGGDSADSMIDKL